MKTSSDKICVEVAHLGTRPKKQPLYKRKTKTARMKKNTESVYIRNCVKRIYPSKSDLERSDQQLPHNSTWQVQINKTCTQN